MSAATQTQCPSWCVGNCENDYHYTEPIGVETIEQPVSVRLTFGQGDPEPLIVLTDPVSTVLVPV